MEIKNRMVIEEQVLSGFSSGEKSEQPDVVSFDDWAEGWKNRTDSEWLSLIHSSANNILRKLGEATTESRAKQEFVLEVKKLKRDCFKSLYGQIIVRLNVLLKLQIKINGKFDLNNVATVSANDKMKENAEKKCSFVAGRRGKR